MDLAEYIYQNLKRGYTPDQLKQALISQKYALGKIERAFATYSTRAHLAKYISAQLSSGFDMNTIVNYISGQGYRQDDIYNALTMLNLQAQANHLHITHTHTINLSKKSIIFSLAAIVLIMGLGYFLSTFLTKNPSELLDFKIEKISVDEEIIKFSMIIGSKGSSKEYDINVVHQIIDNNSNVIETSSETFAISSTVVRPITMDAPKAPGKYYVVSRVKYGRAEIAESSFSFSVGEEVAPTPVKNVTNNTADKNQTVIPDSNDIEDIINLIDESDATARDVCPQITDNIYSDSCYYEFATRRLDSETCRFIRKDKTRDQCYLIIFLKQKDPKLCDMIMDAELQNSCKRLIR